MDFIHPVDLSRLEVGLSPPLQLFELYVVPSRKLIVLSPFGPLAAVTQSQGQFPGSNATTYNYSASAGDLGDLVQEYTFLSEETGAEFCGYEFKISANALKWAINLARANGSVPSGSLLFQYNFTSDSDSPYPVQGEVVKEVATPQPNMTTYFLPMSSSIEEVFPNGTTVTKTIMDVVEVFDFVEVDGNLLPVLHNITRLSSPSSLRPNYILNLQFPSYLELIHYDPSLGFGVLLSSTNSGEGSSGGTSGGLIIGVAVAIPAAILAVLLCISLAFIVGFWRTRKTRRVSMSVVINFGESN